MNSHDRLTIPRPCGRSWQAMTPGEGGRFCQHCRKTVVDFSGLSDAALLARLRATDGPVCGRFSPSQLDRPLGRPEPSPLQALMRGLLGALLLAGMARQVAAASPSPTTALDRRAGMAERPSDDPGRPPRDSVVVRGSLVDRATGQPLAGAVVRIEGTSWAVVADSQGRFAIRAEALPDGAMLRVDCLGFDSLERSLPHLKPGQELTLHLSPVPARLGEICVIRKPGLWFRIGRLFRRH